MNVTYPSSSLSIIINTDECMNLDTYYMYMTD